MSGGWAFGQEGGRVDYLGDFRRENRGSYFSLHGYASGIEVLRFYGFGNETEAPESQDFSKVHATQYVVYPALRVPFAGKWQLSIGPALKYTSNEQDRDELINTVNPYGSGDYGALAVHGILSWDGRDSAVLPRRGAFAAVRGTYFPEAWDVESAFGQVNGNVNAYLPLGGRVTLALRGGGKKVFGTYPYMEAAALGQGGLGAGALEEPENTLRGYRARRFTGDSSAYGNADLRLRVSSMNILVPGVWGLTAFGDVGRVWLRGRVERQVAHGRGRRALVLLADEPPLRVGRRQPQRGGRPLLLHRRLPLLIGEAGRPRDMHGPVRAAGAPLGRARRSP